MTDKLTAALQIAEQVHSLAQEQDEPALMLEAYDALACTLYSLGDFEPAREYAMRGVQIGRSGNVQSRAEGVGRVVVNCLCYKAMS